jgi:indoleamine 2,3-dioxygenase
MLQSPNIDLASFDISPSHGFLPEALPLQKLNDPYFELWEAIVSHLPVLLKNQSLRNQVNKLPILSTSRLTSEREWHRAYLILSFLAHGYIWEAGGPSQVRRTLNQFESLLTEHQILPPSISVPFLDVSSHLELPPTATYAALNLWNFTTLSPWSELTPNNLKVLHTFTGTKDEEWFYLISVAIEARGAKIIPVMVKAIDAARQNNCPVVLSALSKLTDCVREIGSLLKRMYEQCSPDVFYSQIRPFLAGSKNMMVAGLPHGVFYDEGNGGGRWHKYSGGSNAQSSLIQFFDVILGVEHSSTKGPNEGFLNVSRV